MSTNYYVRGYRHHDAEGHIGKRSAAGLYCWNCKITLCKGGLERIHYDAEWYTACPQCGTFPPVDSPLTRHTGVSHCCSFTWAIDPASLLTVVRTLRPKNCPTCYQTWPDPHHVIENEYGTLFRLYEFYDMLTYCPIQFTDRVGHYFC